MSYLPLAKERRKNLLAILEPEFYKIGTIVVAYHAVTNRIYFKSIIDDIDVSISLDSIKYDWHKYKEIYKEIVDFLEEKSLLKFDKYSLHELNNRNINLKDRDYIISFDESNDCKDVIIRFISPQIDYIYLDDFKTLIKAIDEFSE